MLHQRCNGIIFIEDKDKLGDWERDVTHFGATTGLNTINNKQNDRDILYLIVVWAASLYEEFIFNKTWYPIQQELSYLWVQLL